MRALLWIVVLGALAGGLYWWLRRPRNADGTAAGSVPAPPTSQRLPGMPLAGTSGKANSLSASGDNALRGVRAEGDGDSEAGGKPLSSAFNVLGGGLAGSVK